MFADPITIIAIVICLFIVLLVIGAPIFAALGVASFLGMYMQGGMSALLATPSILHRGLASYSLIAIPLFILMGEVVARTDIGSRIYTLFNVWLNRLPGNLAAASIGSCALFGAMSGVSVAGAATIGRFAIPEMLKRGYDPALAGGSVAAAGALALLIPPSIGFILYGEIADLSIGKLFIAALIPALLVIVLMMIYVCGLTFLKPHLAPTASASYGWAEKLDALLRVWPALVLMVAVIGTIYLGMATPTEAAGIGAVAALGISAAQRQLSWATLKDILRSSALTSSMILLILVSALLFGYLITRLMIPQMLAEWIGSQGFSTWVLFLFILGFLLVIGMCLDIVSVILITTPILLPIVIQMGFDPIWFGVILVIACEMAVITPPVGLNLYVIKGVVPELTLKSIMWGAQPFVLVEILAIIILTIFPALVTWLPSIAMSR
ncbi:TRAP transporter large permease [Pseudaminobacter arsenicus]|uniref:TRAP transporter large permease protein n=1 Tax=Borborobacter arsenicus TaxID=1851146 RepID=A0A432UZ12_9HYPH|nr:TRAP transporter large permease [Pseudaminobacter arsenicus]RUM95150.1 TRAP transporter large permease [Pseudaminobacter arsenicus]